MFLKNRTVIFIPNHHQRTIMEQLFSFKISFSAHVKAQTCSYKKKKKKQNFLDHLARSAFSLSPEIAF